MSEVTKVPETLDPRALKTHAKKHGFRIVTPTISLVRYWWSRINLELWDGMLPKPDYIKVRRDTTFWAFCTFPDHGHYGLEVDNYPLTKIRLLEVLAHESVHAALWVLDNDGRTHHGPTFMAYAPLVKARLGLTLGKEIRV